MARPSLQVVLLICLSAGATRAIAQTPPAPPSPFQPPAMRFDARGLTLLEAVRLTLQNDPAIKLRESDVAGQQGVLLSQKGLFDSLFHVSGIFARDQVALLESDRLDQEQVRSDLRSAISEVTTLSQSLTAAGVLLADRNQAYNNPAAMNLSNIRDPAVFNQMTILQSQLVLYRDILASPTLTDATVRNDIVNLRDVTIGRNIDYFNSQQTAIAGAPARMQTRLDNLGPTPEEQWSKQGGFTADVTKLFRNGMTVHPYVDLRYNSQNFVGKDRFDSEFGGLGIQPVSSGKIGFDVVLPLLRGSGRASVAAAETASAFDLEATRLLTLFQQSESVLTTIEAYWRVDAAAQRVDVLRRSVEIQGELANLTRALIAANNRPRSDETRSLAATADARSRYEDAQRELTDARINLAQVMGVALADALSIPLASDPLPLPPTGAQINPQAYSAVAREAMAQRFDRQAALKAEASGGALTEAARLDTRAFLGVNVSGWGTSATQSSISYGGWVFRSGSVGLTYEKPLGNNTAIGVYEAQQSALRSTQIGSADLERVIGLRVVQLSDALRIAIERLRSTDEAVRNYDQTIVNEQARLRAGDSSLIDAILTEQQATGARLSYIDARQEYASLLAALRHEAGILVRDGGVDAAQLVAVPPGLVRR